MINDFKMYMYICTYSINIISKIILQYKNEQRAKTIFREEKPHE